VTIVTLIGTLGGNLGLFLGIWLSCALKKAAQFIIFKCNIKSNILFRKERPFSHSLKWLNYSTR
jgi:ABC-type lipoprotein release transport system permease subunit